MTEITLNQDPLSAVLGALGGLCSWPSFYLPAISQGGAGLPSLNDQIDQVCGDPDSYEADEQPATAKAKDDLKEVVNDASLAYGSPLPVGHIAPYFGEVSITWRNRERMVRITSFSDDRHPRLDFGATPEGALGDYQFDTQATGAKLAEKLTWLLSPPNNGTVSV